MNPEFYGPPDRHDDDRISAHLCRAVGAADFDYATLVDGVHQRAGRIRRRRALTTGAIVAVFGPALLGGSAMVLPGLLPGGVGGTVTPAAPPVAVLSGPPETAPEGDAAPRTATDQSGPADAGGGQADGAEGGHADGASPGQADGAERGQVQEPPWQDGAPPLPEGGLDSADSGNAWQIPDARPTGVSYLDQFGAPQQGSDYADTVPVSGAMMGNTGEDGPRPVAGQSWAYYTDDSWAAGAVDIQITGWEDSAAARDGIRDNTLGSFVDGTDSGWQPLDWAEHAGSADHLLYRATAEGLELGFALVRQGDYLIGVTVTDTTGEVNAASAAEIAGKTADNMQALDPVHGRN